jgi:hypothetical protein
MPHGLRVLFTLAAGVIVCAAGWTLRPGQPRHVSRRWFRLGSKDPFFYGVFNAAGYPRRYAWCVPVAFGVLFVAVVWLAPGP